MQKAKRHLNVVSGTTCFAEHKRYNVKCMRKSCKNWINHGQANNCVLIAAQDGKRTLESIGKIFGLTRMRICQIIKENREKLIKEIN